MIKSLLKFRNKKWPESLKVSVLVVTGIVLIVGVVGIFTTRAEISVEQYRQIEQAGEEFPQLRPVIQNAMEKDGRIDQGEFYIIMDQQKVLRKQSLGERIFGNDWKWKTNRHEETDPSQPIR